MSKRNKVTELKRAASSLALAAAMTGTLGASTAMAQDEAASASVGAFEEIVVTARRRAENLQDVPDSIVAMPSDLVQRASITNVRDITMRVPNVSIVESLSPSSTFIIVRGIATTRNSEPAVAVVVDGVQVGSASEVSQALYDVDQIELLKGPQGALYGRNAIGGALIVTTKKPTDVMEGRFSAGVGDNGLKELNGAISGPITDNLFFRVAGGFKTFDGTIENEYLNRVLERSGRANSNEYPEESYMDFETSSDFRARLLWEPSDITTVDLRYSQGDLESGSMWYRNIYRLESDPEVNYEFPINSNGNPVAYRSIDSYTMKIDHDIDIGTLSSITNFTDTSERYGVAGEVQGHDRTGNVLFFTEPFVDEFIAGLTDPIDTAFFSAELGAWADGNFVGSDQYYDIETFSQEVRLVSNADKEFRYVAGAYFLKTDRDDTIRATWETPDGDPFDCTPAYVGGPSITDFATCNGVFNATQNTQDNSAWALFVSTDYDISDELTLTTALRYDRDTREVTRVDGPTVDTFGLGVGACDSVGDPDNCAAAGSTIEETFDALQPKVSLAYKVSDDMMVYATYARGFRSGGFNASGALLTDSYDKETLDSFEVGAKASFMDGRLRTSFAAFYEKLENSQQFEFDGNIFVQSLYNIPESNIYGIEGSADLKVTDNLTLSGAFGIMDSEIEKFDDDIFSRMESELLARTANTVKFPAGTQAAFDNQFEGEHLPLFAHTTANFALQHELPISALDGRILTTRIDYSLFADRYWWIDGQDIQDTVSLVDASIGMEIAENTELLLWCKNCTDEEYDSEYAPGEKELFGGAMKDVAYQARLRTYGVRVHYSF